MGRVRTKTVKRAARTIIEKYYNKLTLDFYINKRVIQEIASISSNRLKNRITGYATHLMKRMCNGPVRGISFKLQEEERERKDQLVPAKSVFCTKKIELDHHTAYMVSEVLGFRDHVMLDYNDKDNQEKQYSGGAPSYFMYGLDANAGFSQAIHT